ncbi:MAG TPA: galactokinase [Candidatus Dormibacteraeota bacterium]|nr:galactokinase [Candidatus Dormibacteraeota bacterium]
MSATHQLDERARAAFRQTFGYLPGAVAVAPGRINIVGEHTDYNQGFVLPAAIDRQVGVALRLRRDDQIVLHSDRYANPVELASLPDAKQRSWADYVLGVAHEIRRRLGEGPGVEAMVVSELAVGSGLSSSGAVEVAFAVALLAARGAKMSPIDIARLCQAAENEYVGAQTGIMDQLTALKARAGNAMLLDCRSLESESVPLPDARFNWLLADTRVRHGHASSGYNDRRSECERAAKALGLTSLRDAKEEDLERIEDPVNRRRARHVIHENARVLKAAEVLRRRAARDLGPILYASHDSLRVDFEVSCAELDCLVELAADMPQVIGARMMGGGFGGCVLVLLDASGIDDLEQHLAEGYADAYHRAPDFYRVRSVDGALAEEIR